MPGKVAFASQVKPSTSATESKLESPTSQTAMRICTVSPGITLPAVESHYVPPPTLQLEPEGFSKPVPASPLAPSEQEPAPTLLPLHAAFMSCAASQAANSEVAFAMLMPIGHF